MRRTTTPTYRAEYRDQTGWHAITWNVRGSANITKDGAPTAKNAEILRCRLNESFTHRGNNHHVSVAAGYIIYVWQVRVIRQATNEQVATTDSPMFAIV